MASGLLGTGDSRTVPILDGYGATAKMLPPGGGLTASMEYVMWCPL